jgi:Zn ribbon nucleic-acid-binding protein
MREIKGEQIAGIFNDIFHVQDNKYQVKSQSNGNFYDIEETEVGWKCTCPDHKHRGMKCKHIWAVLVSLGIRQQAKPKVILEPITISNCPICNSTKIRKDGIRHNKNYDIQRYECLECGKKFSINIGFERMKHNPQSITTVMQLYFGGNPYVIQKDH